MVVVGMKQRMTLLQRSLGLLLSDPCVVERVGETEDCNSSDEIDRHVGFHQINEKTPSIFMVARRPERFSIECIVI